MFNRIGLDKTILSDPGLVVVKMTRLLSMCPDSAFALVVRAEAYIELGHYEDAINDATTAINIYQNYESAYILRAEALKCLKDFGNASHDAYNAIVLNQNSYLACGTYADVLRQAGHVDFAEEHALRAISLNREYAFGYAVLAFINESLQRPTDAIAYAKMASKLDARFDFTKDDIENRINQQSLAVGNLSLTSSRACSYTDLFSNLDAELEKLELPEFASTDLMISQMANTNLLFTPSRAQSETDSNNLPAKDANNWSTYSKCNA